jgi:hypothetical protein
LETFWVRFGKMGRWPAQSVISVILPWGFIARAFIGIAAGN